ncbi:MAG: metallophosphoesterase [Gammaproteobacteria bacterium]|nr:metallophosphoesterase [Gammaproteobacteria bacterium]
MVKRPSLKLLQLSDTHIQADPNAVLYQVSTLKKLKQLRGKVAARVESIDALFLSGDVSQDGTVKSYQHIAESLSIFQKPVYWFAGNHDAPRVMYDTLASYPYFQPLDSLTLNNWQFLVLDTVREGCDEGYLVENTEARIEASTFCAVWMHHHPTPVGAKLIDKYKLQNPELLSQFLSLQQKKPEVIITGHVHGAYQTYFEGIPVISSPATCFQFPTEATTLAVEPTGGCTFWTFYEDGTFEYEYVYT